MCSSTVEITESDPMQHPNQYVTDIAMKAICSESKVNFMANTRTELDSHANMCVFGDDCFVFE